MNYEESINYIHGMPKFSRVLGNDMLRKLLLFLNNPQKNLKFVHIAGTNGKGSTAVFTAEILKNAGYKVGLFTSPYIEVFNERIQINSENIPDDTLAKIVTEVRDCMEKNDAYVSEFALDAAVAFKYFDKEKCDIVVIETGMGGKLDASNVIDNALVTVLTSISMDHTQYLGDTIEQIADAKCGIIKDNTDIVVYTPQREEVIRIIEKTAMHHNAKIIYTKDIQNSNDGFIYDGVNYKLSVKGSYQPYNARAAIEVCKLLCKKGFNISEQNIIDGLKSAKWMARFEFIKNDLIIDGSHNEDGINALIKSLNELKKDVTIVIAMMEDKAYEECAEKICGVAKNIVVTQVQMDRCIRAEHMANVIGEKAIIVHNPIKAVKYALSICGDGVVCVCGSLYLAGEVRSKRHEFCKE